MHTRIQGMSQTPSSIMRWSGDRAMNGSIDLHLPARSMRRHHHARTRVVVLCVGVGVLLAGIAVMVWRML